MDRPSRSMRVVSPARWTAVILQTAMAMSTAAVLLMTEHGSPTRHAAESFVFLLVFVADLPVFLGPLGNSRE